MATKNNSRPMSNLRKKAWLEAQSEKLVHRTFKNLEDNFKHIEDDYKDVYNELIANITKAVEQHLINGEITSPMLLQNKFVQIVQKSVSQLTALDSTHDEYLRKLLENYHMTITEYQIGLIKLARDEGILFKDMELNETALHVALQIPYKDYDFVTGLNKGTFKVQDRLNKLLVNKTLTGTSVVKLIPQIEEAFNVKKHIAERIARTETSRVLNTACLNTYKQAGLEKVKWLDSTEAIKGSTKKKALVCRECREVATRNDGIYYINEVPSLPLHPHCRCTVTPVVEELPVEKPKKQEEPRRLTKQEKHTLSFKNVAEANKYLEDNLGIISEAKRTAEIKHINSFVNIAKELFEEYPKLKDTVKVLGWKADSSIAYFQWGYTPTDGGKNRVGNLVLTPKYFKKGGLYGLEPEAKPTGWHIKSIGEYTDAERTIYHEFGHAIHNILGHKYAKKDANGIPLSMSYIQKAVDDELRDSREKAFKELGIEDPKEEYQYLLDYVGKYATTNNKELYAECFADVRTNGIHADKFSKLFVEDIERKLKE